MKLEQLSRDVILRASTLARERGFSVSICVVDDSGLLRQFLRMDGAVAGTIDVRSRKREPPPCSASTALTLANTPSPAGPSTVWNTPTAD